MDNKKNGIPKLRFPGFTGAWEQRKLGGFLQEYSIKSKIENEYPLLSSTNKGMEYREGRTTSESNIGYKILKINDLVLSPQNLWLGNININTLVTGIVSPSYKTLKINNLSLYFLLPQLKTKRMLEKYKQVSVQGASVVRRNLDFTEFMNISLVIPTNKEQEQIGEFFKQLDSLIALHQRKLEHLQEQKKGLLQKMFPKNGEIVPEVRFPGFTDAWEQRKLGDFIIEFHEKTTVNDQYPILTSSRKGIFLQTDYYSGNQIASKDNTGYNIVPFGYFTYRHMSDDNIFRFNINKIVDKGIVSTLYPVFTTNKYLDSRYLQIQLNHGNEFAKYALLQKQGGSRTYMYLSKLKKLVLTMPNSISEQKTISNFFDTLDNLITLHQRKLDHLELMKKGLLQQMFV